MEEMVDLLDMDLTRANTEAIIDSVGTISKVAQDQVSTETKVGCSLWCAIKWASNSYEQLKVTYGMYFSGWCFGVFAYLFIGNEKGN